MDLDAAPDAADIQGDHPFIEVARQNWLASSAPITRLSPNVLQSQLWEPLEKENFAPSYIHVLEQLQTLERYLWPAYNQDATDAHVFLIVLLVHTKRRHGLPTWSLFEDRPTEFSAFFRRVLESSIDFALSPTLRTYLLGAIIDAFQSLDNALVRKGCAPLVSISIWSNLHDDLARNRLMEESSQFKKAWRNAQKKLENADDQTKRQLLFDRSWLLNLILDFVRGLYATGAGSQTDSSLQTYRERVLELLCDLLSQFPTRRYVNALIKDLNLLVLVKRSPFFPLEKNALFRDMYRLLSHYVYFPLDDSTGRQYTPLEVSELTSSKIKRLQRTALKFDKDKLQLLILSNHGTLQQRTELQSHLEGLDSEQMKAFIAALGYRTYYPSSVIPALDRPFLLDIILSDIEIRKSFQDIVRDTAILPTESSLYDPSLLRDEHFDEFKPLAVPKLNLQYLSSADFLYRSFMLYRHESFYSIRNDLEETVKRLQPRKDQATGQTRFSGSSRMALAISKPAIIDAQTAKVGEDLPSQVRAEVILDVARLPDGVRKDWEDLKPDDVVFLLNVQPTETQTTRTNGASKKAAEKKSVRPFEILRSAEIISVQDENSRPIRQANNFTDQQQQRRRPRQRRLLLKLDAAAFHKDVEAQAAGKSSIYDSINVIVRRRARENNFKPVLQSIQDLVVSDTPIAPWLQDVFLGTGDPSSASYRNLPFALPSVDFRDTFLNWQHLVDSLPDVDVQAAKGAAVLDPPYVLETHKAQEPVKTSKKRRRAEIEEDSRETVTVSTYKPPNMGPYPSDIPKRNHLKFTPAQVEAIKSGTQPGLTVVVGPPGTGKTDVATQIINNIYHNFPQERTLLIAHSNQALNQLFQKITALDIDQRHLLRLGRGEEELRLDRDASYSKYGRVESMFEIGNKLLAEVNRLASSMAAPGAHGSSCETADYFHTVYVKPAWTVYLSKFQSDDTTAEQLAEEFPFHSYFYNAPQPLFPASADKEAVLETVNGCKRHMDKIFDELSDIRPFEVLRNARERANYLLVKEARIIAMTSTHAAIRRKEIVELGFQYDNVVMEEAAQVTEVETFIPLALQKSSSSLKRIILCGDHLQNSPVIQELSLSRYARLDQSLFQRLIRLGVPTIPLDAQGRARPSLAALYRWRYTSLTDLSTLTASPSFALANAGLRHEYQFIDVPAYKGRGEAEPTPHFLQNLGEAEYVVALYMYMRLLGYAAHRITILTTYAGQRALIKDVLARRCAANRLFGLPRAVATVDKYQGEQNDYVLLSLVRTRAVGYLRDLRRLTVALSRARLGLYVFGRRAVFEHCAELRPAMRLLLARPDKLELVVGEMFPATRKLEDAAEASVMEGVEHLGQYVFEMTKAKVENLRQGRESMAAQVTVGGDEDDDAELEEDEVHGPADALQGDPLEEDDEDEDVA